MNCSISLVVTPSLVYYPAFFAHPIRKKIKNNVVLICSKLFIISSFIDHLENGFFSELKEEAGNPSLLKKLGFKKFFHPYLTYFGLKTFFDFTITLFPMMKASAL